MLLELLPLPPKVAARLLLAACLRLNAKGNWGHAGRPGQRGGSGPSKSVQQIIDEASKPGYKPGLELSKPVPVSTTVTRRLTRAETKALSIWTGTDFDEGDDPDLVVAPEFRFESWNTALRGNKALQGVDQKHVTALTTAIKTSTTTEDVVLFRGVGGNVVSHLQEGATFKDNGFTSLTSMSDVAKNFTENGGKVLAVHVPKGTHLLDVTGSLGHVDFDEGEFLLAPGTRFKVVSSSSGRYTLKILGEGA